MESSLNILFGNDSVLSDRDNLVIEQEEWDVNTGYVTKAALYKALYTLLSGAIAATSPVNCGFDTDGDISTIIYVYPSTQDLAYNLHTTYGSLSKRYIKSHIEKEVINFSISDSASLKYPASVPPTHYWIGTVRDREGAAILPPTVIIEDGKITLSKKVYGSLALQYSVYRHSYSLSVSPRTSDDEDLFGAVIYGNYSEGVAWIELSPPPNADAIAKGETCGGGGVIIAPDSPVVDRPPRFCDSYEYTTELDYCSHDVVSASKTILNSGS